MNKKKKIKFHFLRASAVFEIFAELQPFFSGKVCGFSLIVSDIETWVIAMARYDDVTLFLNDLREEKELFTKESLLQMEMFT